MQRLAAMAIRLLITDVDGTLVTGSKALTERSRRAVDRLRAAGVALAITSARPPRGMAMLVEPLALATPLAAFNGGMFVAPDLETVLDQCLLPGPVAREVVRSLDAAGLDVWVYCGSTWFVRRLDGAHVAREQETVRFAPEAVPDLDRVLDGAAKLVGVSDDLEAVVRCEAELRRSLGAQVSAARSQPYYLDVTHPDANKAMVLRKLAQRLGVHPQEIATIGDMPTDVLMFGLSGLSIAMGNASPDVQRCARYVTTSNEEEGFANAVDWFLLGTRS